jgi:hypothetical protein
MMHIQKYAILYKTTLPFFLIPTTFISTVVGITSCYNQPRDIDKIGNFIGCLSIGMFVGLTYPVSFPLLGIYTFSKNSVKNK